MNMCHSISRFVWLGPVFVLPVVGAHPPGREERNSQEESVSSRARDRCLFSSVLSLFFVFSVPFLVVFPRWTELGERKKTKGPSSFFAHEFAAAVP